MYLKQYISKIIVIYLYVLWALVWVILGELLPLLFTTGQLQCSLYETGVAGPHQDYIGEPRERATGTNTSTVTVEDNCRKKSDVHTIGIVKYKWFKGGDQKL